MTDRYEAPAGMVLHRAIINARDLAARLGGQVTLVFNETEVRVQPDSNINDIGTIWTLRRQIAQEGKS